MNKQEIKYLQDKVFSRESVYKKKCLAWEIVPYQTLFIYISIVYIRAAL